MIRIDARGMRCPWPAVRLARALRGGADEVEVIADDPNAPAEIAATAAAMGATLAETRSDDGSVHRIRAARRNDPFTQSG